MTNDYVFILSAHPPRGKATILATKIMPPVTEEDLLKVFREMKENLTKNDL